MDIEKLAKALNVDTACNKVEIDFVRENYGVGIETAREIIIEPRVLKRISQLVKKIESEVQN
jgi:hypothetical protein